VHRYVIEYDQLLRALDTGFTYETNPYFDYREGFQRMYYLFKPKRFYWICCILLRKISIALVALWFKRVPTFQLALALFIMFSASCAQYVFAPYMAMKDREEVIREHLQEEERVEQALLLANSSIFGVLKDEDGDGVDDTLQRKKSEFVVAVGKKKEKTLKNKKMPKLPYDHAHQRHYAELTKRVEHYFTDYNSLESALLSSSVFVTLGGVMFGSGYFDNPANYVKKEVLTWMIIVLVLGSLAYLARAFYLEVKGALKLNHFRRKNRWAEARHRLLDYSRKLKKERIAAERAKIMLERELADLEAEAKRMEDMAAQEATLAAEREALNKERERMESMIREK
jgi:hypothetical protein